jgi:hypothetical protein
MMRIWRGKEDKEGIKIREKEKRTSGRGRIENKK